MNNIVLSMFKYTKRPLSKTTEISNNVCVCVCVCVSQIPHSILKKAATSCFKYMKRPLSKTTEISKSCVCVCVKNTSFHSKEWLLPLALHHAIKHWTNSGLGMSLYAQTILQIELHDSGGEACDGCLLNLDKY